MDNLAPVLITRKAITDDGLWTHTSPSEKFDGRTQQLLSKYGLMSEETNPVYSKLSQELAENKAKLSFTAVILVLFNIMNSNKSST